MVNTFLKAPKLQVAKYDPWQAWKQPGNDPYAPQTQQQAPTQTTNWGQVPSAQESVWGPYQRANPVAFDYARTATADPSGQMNTTTTTINGGPGVGVGALAPVVAGQARTGLPGSPQPGVGDTTVLTLGGGGGAAWSGQDYRLPSGEVLPGNASFTLTMNNGQQVRVPGYYDPNSATGGQPQAIFMNGTYPETTVQRVQRRLNDAANRGENPNDPQVLYRELARARDDAMVALGLQANDPQLAAKLRAATGFVHLDRFVRGANGETGYTPAPGTAPGAPGAGAAPGAAPGGGGNGQGSAPAGGGGGVFPSEVEMELARQSAPYAIAAYRKARGGGQDKSAVGEFRENMMGQAVRAYLTMLGAGAPGGNPVGMANQGMGDIIRALASGNGVGGILRQQAAQMMGQDLSGFDDTQLLNMFGAAQGAGTFGLGPFAQYALDNQYGDMEHLAQQNALGGGTTAALANPAARKAFMDSLARYLAVR